MNIKVFNQESVHKTYVLFGIKKTTLYVTW